MTFLRPLFAVGAAALIAVTLSAAPVSSARADDVKDGQVLINQLMDSAIRDFGGKTLPFAQTDALLRDYIAKFGSVPLSSQDILGRYWSKATPEEQAEFQKLAVDYAIGSWSKQLADMPAQQSLQFTTAETTPEGRIIQHSLVTNSDTTAVDWQVAHAEDGHLVISDVSVNGVSMVQTMKADFSTIIRANGGKVSALLDALRAKIASYK
ncbi:MAG TPA: ABC transporter substrate-binding protein [Candidatus Sulfotelmatobacter sp.]|jgi:phospholipid transport system substrate-binding protein|nr:ABC transporter substrate-binding protein [Candidatus Sulfotelmatobacter sp.]